MRIRCPACHADYSIEQALEDEAAREMMGVLADLPREVSRPLAAYLGLFRSKSRAVAWERVLRLAREVLTLHGDTGLVGLALSETVEVMRGKQAEPGWKPLGNHNYLKRVLESVAARALVRPATDTRPQAAAAADSHTERLLAAIQRRRNG